jgi:glycosyltransferase involved in cell wall biosynthesis
VISLSVIICAHNPRPDYLRRVLDALKAQTLPKTEWELLLIDNASFERLANTWDLSWHPGARHIREDRLGLVHARLRGIRESNADLLVFVDDDNVMANDYLQTAVQIASDWPKIGVWGGNIEPEFERPVQDWVRPYWTCQYQQDYWSNDYSSWRSQPCGAGMCVRREIAEEYLKRTQGDHVRTALGRKGGSLMAGEDTDIVLTAPYLGLGFGVFRNLNLIHLIPHRRTEEEYLLELITSHRVSEHLLQFARTGELPPIKFKLQKKVADVIRAVLLPRRERKFFWAERKAASIAAQKIRQLSFSD